MLVARVAIVALLAACPSSSTTPKSPDAVDDSPLRIRIAKLEARRGYGIPELIEIAKTAKPARLLALRGLGRIGGRYSIEALVTALSDPDPEIIDAAATALGLATSLDEEDAGTARITQALRDALAKRRSVAVIEAIGRAADASAQAVLVGGLADKPEIAAASAIALGRYGRRKVALVAEARDALVVATKHADARLRAAAAFALAREHPPTPKDERWAAAASSLERLLADNSADVRANAAMALGRRKTTDTAQSTLIERISDADWRVAIEAMRAVAGEPKDADTNLAHTDLALGVMRWLPWSETVGAMGPVDATGQWRAFLRDQRMNPDAFKAFIKPDSRAVEPANAQVVVEGLRLMATHPSKTGFNVALLISRYATSSTRLPDLTRSWIVCLAQVVVIRNNLLFQAHPEPNYAPLLDRTCGLPDHLRLPLVGELVAAKVGTIETRRTALRPLLRHGDARVRVAGMTALAALWDESDAADRRATAATIIAALAAPDGLVAGTAVEAATTIYEADAKKPSGDAEWRTGLDAAVIARANVEKDPELAAALFDLIAKRVIAPGLIACRAGLTGAPVLAKAAAACMKALGQPAEPPLIGGTEGPLQVDIRRVIGKQVRWHLATTRGEIVIELSPEAAPWAVAMIVTLSYRGFYNGLELHRVVPNFVVQGGDPTQSGWGGPGFTIPAEPSSGAGFVAGGVGIADAGRDSGGSQWFVMHGAAPHLDGRYTWVGKVVSGQKSADALLIGDSVTHATLEVRDRL